MPTLVVQMGHSGRTSGATGAPGEMQFTEQVGAACRALLNGLNGWTVRTIAADVSSSSYQGDAFVAVHADGNNNPAVHGSSVGYQTAAGGGLAHAWRDAYVALGWAGPWNADNYTTNLAQYYGVRYAVQQGNTRACIIECGTITNPDEHAAMTGPGGHERVALAIGTALSILTAPPVTTKTQQEDDVPYGTFKPAPDPTKPGHLNVNVDRFATSARFDVCSGWSQALVSWEVFCVNAAGGYTNGPAPYEFGPEHPDRPNSFPVPAGTAAIAIKYVTAPDNTDEVAWRLFENK